MLDAFECLSYELLQLWVDNARIALDNQALKAIEVRVQENVDVCRCQTIVILSIYNSHLGLGNELFLGDLFLLLPVLLFPAELWLLGNRAHLAKN